MHSLWSIAIQSSSKSSSQSYLALSLKFEQIEHLGLAPPDSHVSVACAGTQLLHEPIPEGSIPLCLSLLNISIDTDI